MLYLQRILAACKGGGSGTPSLPVASSGSGGSGGSSSGGK
jgi:hypothetical protein